MCIYSILSFKLNNYKTIFFDVNKAREKPTTTDVVEEAQLSKPDSSAISQLETTTSVGGDNKSMMKKEKDMTKKKKRSWPYSKIFEKKKKKKKKKRRWTREGRGEE